MKGVVVFVQPCTVKYLFILQEALHKLDTKIYLSHYSI
jgi:hypothetical protein